MLGDIYDEDRNPARGANSGAPRDASLAARNAGWAGDRGDQPVLDLAVYWRIALKHRLLILGCFLGVLALGTAFTLLMTPVYTATATSSPRCSGPSAPPARPTSRATIRP